MCTSAGVCVRETCVLSNPGTCSSGWCHDEFGTGSTGVCIPANNYHNFPHETVTTVLQGCGSGDFYSYTVPSTQQRFGGDVNIIGALTFLAADPIKIGCWGYVEGVARGDRYGVQIVTVFTRMRQARRGRLGTHKCIELGCPCTTNPSNPWRR